MDPEIIAIRKRKYEEQLARIKLEEDMKNQKVLDLTKELDNFFGHITSEINRHIVKLYAANQIEEVLKILRDVLVVCDHRNDIFSLEDIITNTDPIYNTSQMKIKEIVPDIISAITNNESLHISDVSLRKIEINLIKVLIKNISTKLHYDVEHPFVIELDTDNDDLIANNMSDEIQEEFVDNDMLVALQLHNNINGIEEPIVREEIIEKDTPKEINTDIQIIPFSYDEDVLNNIRNRMYESNNEDIFEFNDDNDNDF